MDTSGKATEVDITQEMRSACESILPPVCETMIGLLMKVDPEFQDKVRNNVTLAGGTSMISGLAEAPIEEVAGAFANLRHEAPISLITRKVLVPAMLSIPRPEVDATIALLQDNCRRLSGKV